MQLNHRTAFKEFPNYKEEIKNFIKEGKKYKDIAKYFGVHRSTIDYWRKSEGLSFERVNKDKIKRQNGFEKFFNKWGIKKEETQNEDIKDFFTKFRHKHNRCKAAGIKFELKFYDLKMPISCPILGIPLNYHKKGKGNDENTASFDQIVPGKGYTKENTEIISYRANRLKNNGTAEEHIKIANYIKKQLKTKTQK